MIASEFWINDEPLPRTPTPLSQGKFETEDFHTEIVAQVLRNSPELTIEWLRGIGAADSRMASVISVRTQQRFAAL
jgi:hypothetical protein